MYDLIVVGAGPGGYEAAAHAARMGKKVALVEQDRVGGVCLNAGCIPTKALLRSARFLTECRAASSLGAVISPPGFNMAAAQERKNRIVTMLARGVESMLKRAGVEVVRGRARLERRGAVRVGSDSLAARNILLATGSRPAVPPIPGLSAEYVLDSTAALNLEAPPERMAIIGGGYIGLEFACLFNALGTCVTVFEMLPEIAAGADSEVARRLHQSLKADGIGIRTSCRVTRVDPGRVRFEEAAGGTAEIHAECILNATGRTPVVEDLGLEEAGVDFDRCGVKTSDRGRTNVPGIWACGDVTGRRMLAHAATREGIVAVNNMFGKEDRIRYDAIPAVIYTHPEVAGAGKTEDELKRLGIEYKSGKVPMAIAGRFLIEHEGGTGFVKALVGARYREILGVHAVGDGASEFIALAAAMIEIEMSAYEAAEIVFPHPTISEALKEAILEAAR